MKGEKMNEEKYSFAQKHLNTHPNTTPNRPTHETQKSAAMSQYNDKTCQNLALLAPCTDYQLVKRNYLAPILHPSCTHLAPKFTNWTQKIRANYLILRIWHTFSAQTTKERPYGLTTAAWLNDRWLLFNVISPCLSPPSLRANFVCTGWQRLLGSMTAGSMGNG